MHKLLLFAMISTLLLSGCSIKVASAKKNPDEATNTESAKGYSKVAPPIKEIPEFKPQATISFSHITFASTNVRLSLKDRAMEMPEVQYQIWRTADGRDTTKTFSSIQEETDFLIGFDLKEFSGQRGEYQIEVYGVFDGEAQELLAKSTMTFQQYVPILMYHAIDDYKGEGMKDLFVTPANFEAQMRYLKENGYTLLTFERWDEINKVNKPILVTFDDGMKNNLNAFRILQELKDERFQPAATEYVVAGNIDSSPYYLSADDIKEMVNSGIFSIQSHTMSHAELPEIKNFEEELKTSKIKLEQLTGKPVIAIAYPFGHFNQQVVEETKKYYQFATTTRPGQFIEKNRPDEMVQMSRVRISYSTTLKQFAALTAQR
ncbi:polysaccharide deacetylase family protein [Bacillus sp. S3]|uniref:polysaccharide deacetylase family protein n=1 Tax=Bacillus sp. S3 TaxID=486398 RepID=UPI00118B84D0|nr:polysaccharide deacetylase family protein [Bacillus sp. S3]QCJ42212.1 polysaccharide deacetylase family protein [Bacillus sp. S3]